MSGDGMILHYYDDNVLIFAVLAFISAIDSIIKFTSTYSPFSLKRGFISIGQLLI